ncbi:hypothetical protein BDB00DRAFT_792867 [Zychaea mexicana]|uniref:uncharacterized protein n=1 Tax=Zychaea mexicana TaxID=64656 RepID=UPI0022FEB4B9|nr:uncharacterized protein BDB00DRAFT_792867 [Zychaea mexicana]KAI9484439.1 hypothetical protein BDB00DRAFT_792867 [Zychaea mexicana]
MASSYESVPLSPRFAKKRQHTTGDNSTDRCKEVAAACGDSILERTLIGSYKDEGNQLFEEVRQYLQISSWDDILGYVGESSSDGSSSGSKGDDEGDDDNINEVKQQKKQKTYETITFSLRSVIRPEINHTNFLQALQDEQQRVGQCVHELSQRVHTLTDLIATGAVAQLVGIDIDRDIFDIRHLAPKFPFATNATTEVGEEFLEQEAP